jgi:HlyD family secretion protein
MFTTVAVLMLTVGGYFYWSYTMTARTPQGLATANGRVEVERVDIAA